MAYTGTPKTWSALAKVLASEMNAEVRDPITAAATRDSWTPTLSQGTASDISKTVSYAKYTQVGKNVRGNMLLTVTGTGVDGDEIRFTLPVAPAYTGSQFFVLGAGMFRNGTTEYPGVLVYAGSGSLAALRRSDQNSAGEIGADPSILCNSGDLMSVYFDYEAA